MKKCINCGAELLDEAAFCSHCGTACEEDMATQLLEEDEATALLEEKDLQQTNITSSQAEDENTALLDEEMLENSSPDMEENTTVLEEKSSKSSAEIGKKVGMDEIQRNIEKKSKYRNDLNSDTHIKHKKTKKYFFKRSNQKEKIVIITAVVLLIIVITLSVLGFMYNCVQPTISTWDEMSSSGAVERLPISVEDALKIYDVDTDINSMGKLESHSGVVLESDYEGRKLYLCVTNDSNQEKSVMDCEKITEIFLDEDSGKNISIGSRGNLFGFTLNDNNSLYTKGIQIGMSKDNLIDNNGNPTTGFTDDFEDKSIQYAVYQINCYNAISVSLKNNKVVGVWYIKSKNIFDFRQMS